MAIISALRDNRQTGNEQSNIKIELSHNLQEPVQENKTS
jgi:hypothetical protein